jgi:hypothetical protein
LASEISWNHRLFRQNYDMNYRWYCRTIYCPLCAVTIIPVNPAFIPCNNIIFLWAELFQNLRHFSINLNSFRFQFGR